jgi:hypothetical protein
VEKRRDAGGLVQKEVIPLSSSLRLQDRGGEGALGGGAPPALRAWPWTARWGKERGRRGGSFPILTLG